jgi:methylglutamate dehydrogenase subunit C
MSRLALGGLIDRTKPVAFRFDGRDYTGFAGDSLASALLASGVRLFGRSFKYHRPRGVLTSGPEEPNALVTLGNGDDALPNTRATTVPIFGGLTASSQNRWPNLAFDLMAVNQWLSPLFVAGFYYKTFMWPPKLWERLYEPVIRRAAGLGTLPETPDPAVYCREHSFCDLLIIGGGPAGIAAAITAGRAGLRVILADEDVRPGGRLLTGRYEIDDVCGVDWVDAALAELATMPEVRVLSRTCVFGAYDGQEYGALQTLSDVPRRQRYWKIVASKSILAAGAIERPLVFVGNDRPGVMMAGAVSAYLNRFAVAPGRRAVVCTTGDSGWETAADLIAAGVALEAVVDSRPQPSQADWAAAHGVTLYAGAQVIAAHGVPLRQIEIVNASGKVIRIGADILAMAGGWSPAIGLAAHLGHRPVWSDAIEGFVIDRAPSGMTAVGAAAGRFALGDALADGVGSAQSVLAALGRSVPKAQTFVTSEHSVSGGGHPIPRSYPGKAFVDFQHDVTDGDISLAVREGFASVEHLKRYTTLGMATDQGKTSHLNGHMLLAAATARTPAEAGTIMARPPWQPVPIGAFAGFHREVDFRPERRTASHDWAAANGAVFVDVGQWKRAQWFAQPGERDWLDSVNREVMATRGGVGVCDVSTLGKIELHGPDAGTLLDRLYVNGFSAMPVGKARYGLMLREDGFVLDDGTVTRFGESHYFVTTTTANAARVMQHIDFARQVLWPELDAQAVSVTEQWATYAIAGPFARKLVQRLLPDLDLSNATFPFMAAAETSWGKCDARLFRVSFSGELAFELAVPASFGEELLLAILKLGSDLGITPYGTEALGVMRIEKGHAAGAELNGQTTAFDLGMGRMLSAKKDFIGRAMAGRPALISPYRPRLVGLRPVDGRSRIRAGAHLLPKGAAAHAVNDQGYVTSAAFSPTLGLPIALALLRNGPDRYGEILTVHDPVRDGDVEAIVCNPVFVDPDGERVRG